MARISSLLSSIFFLLLKRWYIVVILLAIGGYFLYQGNKNKAKAETKTYTVKRETLKEILSLSGEMNVGEKVTLKFQSGGRLVWVGVKEGEYVSKNQGIASLDQRQLEKTLQKYLNTYVKQRHTFDQTFDTNESLTLGLTSEIRERAQRLIDQGQIDLNNTVIDVELQTIAKENAYLSTPIDGIVTRVDTPKAGMNVSITDQFEIINPDTLYFSVDVDQTDVVQMYEGQRGTITLDAYPDQKLYGTVTEIGFMPQTDETGTTYEVKMVLESMTLSPRVGMTGDAEFVLNEIPRAVAVPVDFVEETDDKTYVYKQMGKTFKKTEVTTGKEYDGIFEIKTGLFDGDVISEIPE